MAVCLLISDKKGIEMIEITYVSTDVQRRILRDDLTMATTNFERFSILEAYGVWHL